MLNVLYFLREAVELIEHIRVSVGEAKISVFSTPVPLELALRYGKIVVPLIEPLK